MNARPHILILTAIEMEFRHVAAECVPAYYDDTVVGPREPTGQVGNWAVSVKKIGIKAPGLGAIEIPPMCKLIIMAGLAGGLDPTLVIGDIIVAGAPPWLKLPLHAKAREIVTTDRAVTSSEAKADFYAKTRAAAVDMETSIVREWAKTKGIDFVAIRAISDTASDAIDPRVMALVDAYGRTRPTHVGSYILGNPLRIGKLIKLGRNSTRAAQNLGKAVREMIEAIPESESLRDRVS